MQRTHFFLTILGVATLSSAAGWIASTRIQSPADAALRTAAPTPSLILAPVELRVLNANVVTRGTARYDLPQTLALAASGLKANHSVIAQLPKPGSQLNEGSVALSASGRPVWVFAGQTPAYRDLGPGQSGDDVLQLEQALKRLGFLKTKADRHFDLNTSAALRRCYSAQGWQALGPTVAQTQQLQTFEQQLGEAQKQLLQAANDLENAKLAVQSASANALLELQAAELEVKEQSAAFYRIKLDPRQPKTALETANAKLDLARAKLDKAQLDTEVAEQSAQDRVKLESLKLQLAEQNHSKLSAQIDSLKSRLGAQLPLDEVLFIPSLPVRVQELMVKIGDPASGPILSVTNNQIVIDASLSLSAAALVKPGMPVTFDERALGIKGQGQVSLVDHNPGSRGLDAYHVYMQVSVAQPLANLAGASLRLRIPVQSSVGEVLVVPVSALSLGADGQSRVQRHDASGSHYVTVETGLSANGYVEIRALNGELQEHDEVVIGYDKG